MECGDGSRNWLERAREVLDIEIQGLNDVKGQLDDEFVRAVESMAACKGRVVITGLGKSGLVGRKIAATLSSTGTPSFFLHPVEGAHGDMGMIRAEDVVLAISNSGETDELNAIIPTLRSLGATVVSLTAKRGSTMSKLSDITIQASVSREACAIGLAPTASTTAHLAVGDALAVCLMRLKDFDQNDFRRFHPGGALGQRLSRCIADFMHCDNMPTASSDAPLGVALRVLHQGGLGLVAVVEGMELKGVLSDGDVRRLVVADQLDAARPVAEVMTVSPRTASIKDSAAKVLDIMEAHEITVLPVTDGTRLVGMVHLHDLLGKGSLRFANGNGG